MGVLLDVHAGRLAEDVRSNATCPRRITMTLSISPYLPSAISASKAASALPSRPTASGGPDGQSFVGQVVCDANAPVSSTCRDRTKRAARRVMGRKCTDCMSPRSRLRVGARHLRSPLSACAPAAGRRPPCPGVPRRGDAPLPGAFRGTDVPDASRSTRDLRARTLRCRAWSAGHIARRRAGETGTLGVRPRLPEAADGATPLWMLP